MPQHKSAKKRLRQSDRKKTVNKAVKSNVSTQLKAIDKLIKDKKVEESMAVSYTHLTLPTTTIV